MGEAYLNKIVTRVPPNEMHAKFLALIPRLVPAERDRKIFARLVSKAQIETRYSVLKPSLRDDRIDEEGFYIPGAFPSTAKRMALFEREAVHLAEAAATQLLEREDRASITHLIVTTCTGFVAPGLDLELQRRLGLRTELERTVIGFMGCYAAMNALKCASAIVRARPDAKILLLNLELCSIHLQEPRPDEPVDFEQLLGFLQFADGCAASLVSRTPVGLRLDGFRAEVLPERRELIQWRIGDSGFQMRLALEVPVALGQKLPDLMERTLAPRSVGDVALWAVHPGGRAILDVVQEKLGLSDEALAPSREVLRRFGNMSSATVMFVLDTFLREAKHEGDGLAMAFGPGLTLETMSFSKRRG